jgi:hypothetical protein
MPYHLATPAYVGILPSIGNPGQVSDLHRSKPSTPRCGFSDSWKSEHWMPPNINGSPRSDKENGPVPIFIGSSQSYEQVTRDVTLR